MSPKKGCFFPIQHCNAGECSESVCSHEHELTWMGRQRANVTLACVGGSDEVLCGSYGARVAFGGEEHFQDGETGFLSNTV